MPGKAINVQMPMTRNYASFCSYVKTSLLLPLFTMNMEAAACSQTSTSTRLQIPEGSYEYSDILLPSSLANDLCVRRIIKNELSVTRFFSLSFKWHVSGYEM
jgi:hypothetical protein